MSSRPDPSPVASPRRNGWLILTPVAVVAVIGLGAAGAYRLPAQAPSHVTGEKLKIEVVQPPAPPVTPGPPMEVGELVDGYRHVRADPRPADSEGYELLAWLEPLPPLPRFEPEEFARPQAEPIVEPTARQPLRTDRPANAFGFDEPSPDFKAAREARRERIRAYERMQAQVHAALEEWDRPRRRAGDRMDGWDPRPQLEGETTFY